MTLAQPVARRKWLRRAKQEPLYGLHLPERMGYYTCPAEVSQRSVPLVWLHTVSLGETRAVVPFLQALRQALPGMRLLLTHGTATGREAGQALLQAGDLQVWQPWDSPAAVQRFVRHFQPSIGLLMETEVWPNLAHVCREAGIPLCLVNARMSEKTLRQSLRWSSLALPAYRALHGVWAQTEADAQRLRQLGATVQGVMGNFKYDVHPSPSLQAQGRAWRDACRVQQGIPVLLFASSREGEETLWLEALQTLSSTQQGAPRVQWLVVPRHPQRFGEVAQLLEQAGYVVQRRSQWGDAGPQLNTPQPTVWLGDSLGEMPLYFGMAHVALLGGSFAPLGGQNLIEAAACGVPIVMGPHTFNFTQACLDAEQTGVARRVADIGQAVHAATAWAYGAQLPQTQVLAQDWVAQHRGAAQRTAHAVRAVLG
ncbi:3-deoxy-D-manno-octulosonic acid transferase [Curvibacter sp. CHRR-16]|nr:3-deoxy-D-manno-octulosonic acid transferase [Curvibacter sp. CHRR-16]